MVQLPAGTRRLIERKLAQLARAPREAVNVKRLKGHPHGYRVRVGDWRVVYTLDDKRLVVAIIRIAIRGGVYK